jgi:hypothetical protein
MCISQCHFLYGRCNSYTVTFHIHAYNSDDTTEKRQAAQIEQSNSVRLCVTTVSNAY